MRYRNVKNRVGQWKNKLSREYKKRLYNFEFLNFSITRLEIVWQWESKNYRRLEKIQCVYYTKKQCAQCKYTVHSVHSAAAFPDILQSGRRGEMTVHVGLSCAHGRREAQRLYKRSRTPAWPFRRLLDNFSTDSAKKSTAMLSRKPAYVNPLSSLRMCGGQEPSRWRESSATKIKLFCTPTLAIPLSSPHQEMRRVFFINSSLCYGKR